jgi:hypothetical protein
MATTTRIVIARIMVKEAVLSIWMRPSLMEHRSHPYQQYQYQHQQSEGKKRARPRVRLCLVVGSCMSC